MVHNPNIILNMCYVGYMVNCIGNCIHLVFIIQRSEEANLVNIDFVRGKGVLIL